MAYDLLLFDLDGTLTDPYEGMVSSFDCMFKAMNLTAPPNFDIKDCIGPPLRACLRKYFTLTDGQVEEAVIKFREHQYGGGMFQNKLYDGVLTLLERLKNEGYTLSIATSKISEGAVKIAEYFDFSKYFDFISGSVPDGSRNTKPQVITYALDNVDKDRRMKAVMIGDREYDIFGARETGIDSIGVLWGFGTAEELKGAGAVRLAADMDELYRLIKSG